MYEEYLNVWLDTLDIRGEMQQAFIIEIKGTRSKKEKKSALEYQRTSHF